MRFQLVGSVLASIALAAVLQLALPALPSAAGTLTAGAVICTAGVVSAVGSARRSRTATRRHRIGWAVASGASALLAVAYAVFAGYAVAGIEPRDSPGGLLSIVAAAGSMGAVLLLAPRLPNVMAWCTHLLDVAIVAVSMFTLAWQVVVVPVAATMTAADERLFVSTAVPEVCAAALALVLVSRTEPGQHGYALHLIAGSLGIFAVAAVLTTYNLSRQLAWYASGAALTTVLAVLLFVLATRASLAPEDRRQRRVFNGAWAALPYVPVAVALVVIAVLYVRTGTLVPALTWALLATSALAMVRQFLSLVTVRRLLGRLDEQRDRLHHQAHHDGLTGLPNRSAFHADAERILAAAGPGELFAVLLLDLDGFKPVNDTHGHAAGDRTLMAVGQRFAAVVRPGDVVARLGGDEFGVVLGGIGEPAQADEIAARLVARAAEPVPFDGGELRVGASAGIALARGPGHRLDRLLKHADDALYEAKAAGRNQARRSRPAVLEKV